MMKIGHSVPHIYSTRRQRRLELEKWAASAAAVAGLCESTRRKWEYQAEDSHDDVVITKIKKKVRCKIGRTIGYKGM